MQRDSASVQAVRPRIRLACIASQYLGLASWFDEQINLALDELRRQHEGKKIDTQLLRSLAVKPRVIGNWWLVVALIPAWLVSRVQISSPNIG